MYKDYDSIIYKMNTKSKSSKGKKSQTPFWLYVSILIYTPERLGYLLFYYLIMVILSVEVVMVCIFFEIK